MSILIHLLGCLPVCVFHPYALSLHWHFIEEEEHPWERDHSAGWQ